MKTILACGSRDWTRADEVHLVLLMEPHVRWRARHSELRLLHGDQRGADTLASEAAEDIGYGEIAPFPAEVERFGSPAAFHVRNDAMLNEQPDLVIAFGDGPGTRSVVKKAERRGIPVKRVP